MLMKRVNIKEPDATVYYHFKFQLGDGVEHNDTKHRGTIVDAVWEGDPSGGAYTVEYWVKTDEGVFRAMEPELRRKITE